MDHPGLIVSTFMENFIALKRVNMFILFHIVLLFFQGVLDRFSQIQPKVIFSVNAVHYNGKVHNHLDKLQKVVEGR